MRCADADPMAEIRAATRPEHEALEADAGILERVRTPQGYAAVIGVFTALHEEYEPQIDAFAERFARHGFSARQRSKRALLADDRARLRDRFAIDAAAPPAVAAHPRITTFAEAVGWLYVFEGSTLGGMMIAQHARSALGIGTSYYGAYGRDSARKWREFGDFVRGYVACEPEALPEIIGGAQRAFGLVRSVFNT